MGGGGGGDTMGGGVGEPRTGIIYISQTQSFKVPTPYKLPNPEPQNEKLLFHPGDWKLGLGAFWGLHA